jgi:hypothetical protein
MRMDNKKGNKGMVWTLSKLAILLAGVMLSSLLFLFYTNFTKILASYKAVELSRDLGKIIDEVGSAPHFLRIKYKLEEKILGEDYEVEIKEKEVNVKLKGKYAGAQYNTSFLSTVLVNISKFNSGYTLNIEKNPYNNSTVIVY